jgi:hypothetical protein
VLDELKNTGNVAQCATGTRFSGLAAEDCVSASQPT